MTGTSDAQSVDVRQYLEVPRRRWRIVLIVALVGIIAFAGYAQLASSSYEATSVVRIDPIGADPFTSGRTADQLVNTDSEAQIARSSDVAERAAELLSPAGDPEAMRDGLAVTAAADTASLTLAYTADTRQAAVEGANAFAQAYLDNRQGEAREQQRSMLRNVEVSIGAAREELIAAEEEVADAEEGTQEWQEANADRQIANSSIQNLSARRTELETLAFSPGTVLREAEQASPASMAGGTMFLVAGVLASLVVALLAAFVRDGLDKRVRTGRDVSQAVRAPLLAEIPAPSAAPLVDDPGGVAAESYRLLRAQLVPAARRAGSGRVLLVADLTHANRSGTAGASLAVAIAQAQNNVALLMPGWPSSEAAGLGALDGTAQGYAPMMQGSAVPGAMPGGAGGDALVPTSVPGLRVAYGDGLRTLMASDHFQVLMADLTANNGYVVLDASGQLTRSEILTLAGVSGAAVVVGRVARTRSTELESLAIGLEQLGTPIAGCAVVVSGRKTGNRERQERFERQDQNAAAAPGGQRHRRAQSVRA
jgi:capsular polysaccharide biosynthesis protein/Mrp family chromosome partitioning ATPase